MPFTRTDSDGNTLIENHQGRGVTARTEFVIESINLLLDFISQNRGQTDPLDAWQILAELLPEHANLIERHNQEFAKRVQLQGEGASLPPFEDDDNDD